MSSKGFISCTQRLSESEMKYSEQIINLSLKTKSKKEATHIKFQDLFHLSNDSYKIKLKEEKKTLHLFYPLVEYAILE